MIKACILVQHELFSFLPSFHYCFIYFLNLRKKDEYIQKIISIAAGRHLDSSTIMLCSSNCIALIEMWAIDRAQGGNPGVSTAWLLGIQRGKDQTTSMLESRVIFWVFLLLHLGKGLLLSNIVAVFRKVAPVLWGKLKLWLVISDLGLPYLTSRSSCWDLGLTLTKVFKDLALCQLSLLFDRFLHIIILYVIAHGNEVAGRIRRCLTTRQHCLVDSLQHHLRSPVQHARRNHLEQSTNSSLYGNILSLL